MSSSLNDIYHKNESREFDWNQIVTKSVETNDGKDIGKVDGLEDLDFVVKDGLIDPKYYRIPRDKVEAYENGKVRLSLSEEQAKSEYQESNPGYYRRLHDPDKNSVIGGNNNSGRTSNTIT